MAAVTTHASARWTQGEQFVATASSRHALVVDADRETNSGPGPMELVLMGLCGCTATDVVMILRKSRQAFTRLEVAAAGDRAPEPPQVYTRIHLVYRVAGPTLDPAAVERAVRLSHEKYCSVSIMLSRAVPITFEIALESQA